MQRSVFVWIRALACIAPATLFAVAAICAEPLSGGESASALVERAKDLYREKKYAEAEIPATRAIELEPAHAVAHRVRGMVRTFLERYDEALADLNFALKSNPKDADATRLRGNLYRRMKKTDLAIADYTEAIRLFPQYSSAYRARGEIYEELGQNEQAAADFQQAEKFKDYLRNRRAKAATAPARKGESP